MRNLIVVDSIKDWTLEVPNAEVVSSKAYLTEEIFRRERSARIFNVCRSYKYQSMGYYVSLLAAARGHKTIPTVATIQDMKSQTIVRLAAEDLDELIQKSLADIRLNEFVLSIYFGKNLAKKYERLSAQIYRLFHAPFIRAHFAWDDEKWVLRKVVPISPREIPPSHQEDVARFSKEYFEGKRTTRSKKPETRFSLAILTNSSEEFPPSNAKALERFVKAAEKLHMEVELITRDDFSRLAEFDGLFIRETTNVNHHTFNFARRAAAEGLVVIDDPESILRCTNKVYLNELLEKNDIPSLKTMIVHKENVFSVVETVGLPCVLKQPDSSFSQGVVKVTTEQALLEQVHSLLEKSELVIAQEFVPTDFDWRVGMIDGKPLYVSKYYMAKKHWQIIKRDENGRLRDGKSETIPVELAPRKLITLAQKAAHLIGHGFYGLDIKEVGKQFKVLEINDNPSIDAGCEDLVLKDQLYMRIMEVFLQRMILKKEGRELPY